MVWRYNAGLGLIGAFVFIWVSSAEVTQKIFVEYKQPFAVTYLGDLSLMAIFLPIAAFLDVPLKLNDMHNHPEGALEDDFIADLDYIDPEEGFPLVDINHKDEFHFLEESYEHNSWDSVKQLVSWVPIWFATEYFSNSALANTTLTTLGKTWAPDEILSVSVTTKTCYW
ncbi:hypothetical protein HAX54_005376 [Datura stramonium]|uniref:Uncharacterized protein n=1 Tax=Datura stramonium TaxID=4076 RepID=A0ABS8T8M1_DATST|nr:hypothetical protein [Datura stramonium]